MVKNKNFSVFLIIAVFFIIQLPVVLLSQSTNTKFELSGGEYLMFLKMNLQKNKYSHSFDVDPEAPALQEIKYGAVDQDHVVRLNFLVNPVDYLKGDFQLEVTAGDPYLREKDIWHNDSPDFLNPKIGTYLTRADFLIMTRYFDTRIYKWAEHGSSGDLLDLYPAQWELEQSRRWGTFLPEGVEVTGKETINGLFLAVGQAPSYHSNGKPNNSLLFTKYALDMDATLIMFMYKHKLVEDQIVDSASGTFTPPSTPLHQVNVNDRIAACDITLDFLKFTKSLDVLIEGEVAGNFPARPKLVPEKDRKDVYYTGALKGIYKPFSDYLKLSGRLDYADVYSGNLRKMTGGVAVKPMYTFTIDFQGSYQEPLRDAVGTNFTTLPFVNMYNRKGEILSLSLTYDPTPLTEFNDKNANYDEDASLALQVGYVNSYYPTWTDIPIKVDYVENKYSIPAGGAFGLYPIELHKLFFKMISSKWYPFQIILYAEGGKKQAEYPSAVVAAPWTVYYDGYIEFAKLEDFSFSLLYSRSDWETPLFSNDTEALFYLKLDNFHKEEGLPIDHRWLTRIRKFIKTSYIELRYELQIIDFSSEGYRDAKAYKESEFGENYKKAQSTQLVTAEFGIRF
ncbi:MAG: hypothetical protein KKH98_05700 [Spirochaetes bacterium]|nr:hypothetical protein [Spirochaetota bacterium]